jgi:hypothetical protein
MASFRAPPVRVMIAVAQSSKLPCPSVKCDFSSERSETR